MTWTANPSDKDAAISLSGGNLIVTSSGFDVYVRGTESASSGKYYWEIEITNDASSFAFGLGLANGSAALNSWPGSVANNAVITFSHNPQWDMSGGSSGAASGFTEPNVVGIAVDITAELIWITTNGTTWYGSNSSGNPATGANGFNWAALNAGPYYPLIGCGTGDIATIKPSSASWSRSPPSGFGELGPGGGGGPTAKENTGLHHIEAGSPMGKKTNGLLHPIKHGIVGWRKGFILPKREIIRVTHTSKRAA